MTNLTSTDTTLTPGLAGVRARIAEQTREAKRIAATLRDKDPTWQTLALRLALMHVAGAGSVRLNPPEQPTLDVLVGLGVIELADHDAAQVCGRYRPTDLGAEVLGLIGVRG